MPAYLLHGLGFAVEGDWPGATAAPATVDVRVTRGAVAVAPAWVSAGWQVAGTWDDTVVYWRETGPFRVVAGREIILSPPPVADLPLLADTVLGEVGGIVLVQRGCTALHASAVALAGQALVFLGESGSGKSTLAAALVQRGAEFLADDVLRVAGDHGHPQAVPSHPRLKFASANCRAAGVDPTGLPAAFRGSAKRVWTPARVAAAPLPVAAVYTLTTGPDYGCERLPAAAALLTLLHHSFAGYLHRGYGFDFLGSAARQAAHFQRLAQLPAAVPGYRLTRPAGAPLDVARLLRLLGR